MGINLNNKTSLVTGASKGIGKAIAIELANAGSDVVITYNTNKDKAMEVVAQIQSMGRKAMAFPISVESLDETRKLVKDVIDKFGGIDILVNNAGITKDSSFFMMSKSAWNDVIEVDLYGVFNCCKSVIGHMISRKSGKIINICSVSGFKGIAGQTNYSAAKAGVIGFTKSLSQEVGRYGILVNGVAPGFIESDMTEEIDYKIQQKYIESIPLKRFGSPEEVANLVTFLASDYCSYISGEIITIDGGLTS